MNIVMCAVLFTICHGDVCLCSAWQGVPDWPWLRGQLGRRPASITPQSKQTHSYQSASFSAATSQRKEGWTVKGLVCDHSYCNYGLCCSFTKITTSCWGLGKKTRATIYHFKIVDVRMSGLCLFVNVMNKIYDFANLELDYFKSCSRDFFVGK